MRRSFIFLFLLTANVVLFGQKSGKNEHSLWKPAVPSLSNTEAFALANSGNFAVFKFTHSRLGPNDPNFDIVLLDKTLFKSWVVLTGNAMDSALMDVDQFLLSGDTLTVVGSLFKYDLRKRMAWMGVWIGGLRQKDSIWEQVDLKRHIDTFRFFEDFTVLAKTADSTWAFVDYPVYSMIHPVYDNKYFAERKVYEFNYKNDSLKIYATPKLHGNLIKLHEEVYWNAGMPKVLGLYKNPARVGGVIHGVYWGSSDSDLVEKNLYFAQPKGNRYKTKLYPGSSGGLSYNQGAFELKNAHVKLWEQSNDQIIATAYNDTAILWAYVFDNYCNSSPYPVFVGQQDAVVLLTYNGKKGISAVPGRYGAESCNLVLTRVSENGRMGAYSGKGLGKDERYLVYPQSLIDFDGKSVGLLYSDLQTGELKLAVFSF